jgi:hypothetical protein
MLARGAFSDQILTMYLSFTFARASMSTVTTSRRPAFEAMWSKDHPSCHHHKRVGFHWLRQTSPSTHADMRTQADSFAPSQIRPAYKDVPHKTQPSLLSALKTTTTPPLHCQPRQHLVVISRPKYKKGVCTLDTPAAAKSTMHWQRSIATN